MPTVLPAQLIHPTLDAAVKAEIITVEREYFKIGNGTVEPSGQLHHDMPDVIFFDGECGLPLANKVKPPVLDFSCRGNVGGDLDACKPLEGLDDEIVSSLAGAPIG